MNILQMILEKVVSVGFIITHSTFEFLSLHTTSLMGCHVSATSYLFATVRACLLPSVDLHVQT